MSGDHWHHKRVYRIYRELELNLMTKPRKPLKRDAADVLVVLDDFNREGLGIEVVFSLSSERIHRRSEPDHQVARKAIGNSRG